MHSKAVDFGFLHLTSEQDQVHLSVCAVAEFRFPQSFSATTNQEIIKQLSTGGLWASRGFGCYLNLFVSVDGKVAGGSQSHHLIEAIAYRLRNAPLWSQISFLASAASSHSSLDESIPHISIDLNRGHQLDNNDSASKVHSQVDMRPPESVPCAEFMGLRIHFNFSRNQIQPAQPKTTPTPPPATPLNRNLGQSEKLGNASNAAVRISNPHGFERASAKTKKRKKPLPKTPLSKEIMILDEDLARTQLSLPTPETPGSDLSNFLDNAASSLKNPKNWKLAPVRKGTKLEVSAPRSDRPIKQEDFEIMGSGIPEPAHTPNKKRQRVVKHTATPTPTSKVNSHKGGAEVSKRNHAFIKAWLEENKAKSYPTKPQMQELLTNTGYSRGAYLVTLLGKFRTSIGATMIKMELNASPCTPPTMKMNVGASDEMLLNENEDAPCNVQNDDMLLDPLDDSLPWFDYACSPTDPKSRSLFGSAYYELESSVPNHPILNIKSSIPIPSACLLSETALRFLVGGEQRRCRGVEASPTTPENSLSLLVPSLFNPGFNSLMAQNARFLPTIATAISVSLVRNKQGVGLRKKLFLVSFAGREVDQIQSDEGTIDLGRKMKMKDVVERRLWSMMHRKLHEARTARNLRHTSSDGVKNHPIFEDHEDLLLGMESNYDSQESQETIDDREEVDLFGERHEYANRLDHGDVFDDNSSIIFDDEDKEFEDLFHQVRDDDEGLISYLDDIAADKERRETERETNELLLGRFPSDDDFDDDMLLDGRYYEQTPMAETVVGSVTSFIRAGRSLDVPVGIGWR